MALGLYIHIPFCACKCPYCDFYSLSGQSDSLYDDYVGALERSIGELGGIAVDTVYFGGGTPSVLGGERLSRVLDAVKKSLEVDSNAEITVEINPGDAEYDLLGELKNAGFNRISMGVQSGVDSELRVLGRRHDTAQAARAVALAREVGFGNISLDLMLAIPQQTKESLARSIDFLCGLHPEHISAYILKIEEGTPFAEIQESLNLPDDDGQAELYLEAVSLLGQRGYAQYEISNFSLPGRESRHNLKYWHCEEYIGVGASAHSFYNGRRYYYPRDIMRFINAPERIDDGEGGSAEEYAMLALRLTEGLTAQGWQKRFGEELPQLFLHKAKRYGNAGLLCCDESGIRLTPEGFLVSNGIIADLISR